MTCTVLRVEPPVLFEHTHFVDGRRPCAGSSRPSTRGDRPPVHASTSPTSTAAIEGCWIVGHAHLAGPPRAGARRPPVPWDWDAFAAAQAHYAEPGLAAPCPTRGVSAR